MEITQIALPTEVGTLPCLGTNIEPEAPITPFQQPILNKSETPDNATPKAKEKPVSKRKWLKVLKWTGYTIGYSLLGLISLAKTPGVHVAVNDYLQARGLAPTPTNSARSINNEHGYDNFFINYPGFEDVRREIELLGGSGRLDLNNNDIALDTQSEVRLLKEILNIEPSPTNDTQRQSQIRNSISKLDEINSANLIIWGENPDPNYLFQSGRPNCQLMGAIQAHYLTPQNLQVLKNLIEVTNFDPASGRIDTVVHLHNGRSIPVPFEDLVRWMSPIGITPSYSTDGTTERPITLAVPILTYALEKELSNNYDGVPPTNPSSSPILLTGDNYSTICLSPILLNTFTDSELANIFSMAPERPIMLASWGTMADLDQWFSQPPNNGFVFLPQSDLKANEFRRIAQERTQGITTNNTQRLNPNTNSNQQTHNAPGIASNQTQNNQTQSLPTINTLSTNNILRHHVYVVRGYNPVDKTVIIMDSNGTNSSIKLNELRSHWSNNGMVAVIMQRDDVPTISNESLMSYFLLLLIATGHFTLPKIWKKLHSNPLPKNA